MNIESKVASALRVLRFYNAVVCEQGDCVEVHLSMMECIRLHVLFVRCARKQELVSVLWEKLGMSV